MIFRNIALTVAALSAVVLAAPVASAATVDTSPAAGSANLQVESEVQGLLRFNPGARRVAGNAVDVGNGVVITIIQPNSLQGCDTGWLCLNADSDFRGAFINFFFCGDVNLGRMHMSDGRLANDQVSSIRNAQTGGVQSRFYNYDGSGDPDSPANWRLVLGLNAGSYLRDLSKDTSLDGGNANDKIDIVHVC